jgi:hypothetical protein
MGDNWRGAVASQPEELSGHAPWNTLAMARFQGCNVAGSRFVSDGASGFVYGQQVATPNHLADGDAFTSVGLPVAADEFLGAVHHAAMEKVTQGAIHILEH